MKYYLVTDEKTRKIIAQQAAEIERLKAELEEARN